MPARLHRRANTQTHIRNTAVKPTHETKAEQTTESRTHTDKRGRGSAGGPAVGRSTAGALGVALLTLQRPAGRGGWGEAQSKGTVCSVDPKKRKECVLRIGSSRRGCCLGCTTVQPAASWLALPQITQLLSTTVTYAVTHSKPLHVTKLNANLWTVRPGAILAPSLVAHWITAKGKSMRGGRREN